MAGARPWTAEDDDTLRAAHAAGKSLHSIAREMGRGKATVSVKAAALGLTWDRAQVGEAVHAKVVDAKARRAILKDHLLDDAARLRTQLWTPAVVFNFGGKDNTYEQRTLDKPPFADQLKIMQATSSAIATYERLERLDDDAGASDGRSMLERLAKRLDVKGPDQ